MSFFSFQALSDKRGNAEVAQTLYELKGEQPNQKAPPPGMELAGHREKGKGRPTKKERRELEKFQGFWSRDKKKNPQVSFLRIILGPSDIRR